MERAAAGGLPANDGPQWQLPRPGARDEFTTTDPAAAHAYLRAAYTENTMRIKGNTDGFRLRSTYHEAGGFAVSWLSHTMAVEHLAQPPGSVLVGRVLVGSMERETEDETLRAGVDDVFLVARPDRPYRAAWETMRLQVLRIDLEAAGVPATFGSLRPVSPEAGRVLKRTLNYACSAVLAKPEALASPLVVAGTTRALAAAVQNAFGDRDAAEHRGGGPGSSGPAGVRRAVDYVDSNAHMDIALADIAAAAGLSPRGAQRAFRRQLGVSPIDYLRGARLERAHRDLLAADPARGDTVAAIRLRWGFVNASRFANVYRRTYGIAPERTLHT